MSINDNGAYPMEMTLNKKSRVEEMNPYLPEELVIDEIFTRLPFQTLAQYSCISKLWYNLISKDTQFAKKHFLHSKTNRHKLNLVFNLLNTTVLARASFYSLDDDYKFRLDMNIIPSGTTELVGYCNGLACVTLMCKAIRSVMIVVNPVKMETLSIPYYHPKDVQCAYLCHGFGFDPSRDEYKVVMIFITRGSTGFIVMVFTLGTNSWRKVVISVDQISIAPGCYSFPGRLVTTTATLCGGDLYWRLTSNIHNEVHDNNKIGVLLSFDIQKEKIQILRFPIECSLTLNQTTMNVVVEHHILEHKGYPCIARSEKTMRNIMHPCSHCGSCQSNCCCCSCSFIIQLYILKDKEKLVWIKGETFCVQVRELGLPPSPFCCYFDATTGTSASFPTRILSVSGKLLLHWFDGKCLKIYNLQTKRLEVVTSLSSCDPTSPSLFEIKMNRSPPANGVDSYGKIYYPHRDYQLHTQAENMLSLKTFIPPGETSTFYKDDDFIQFLKLQIPAGWVNTTRESVKLHAFF